MGGVVVGSVATFARESLSCSCTRKKDKIDVSDTEKSGEGDDENNSADVGENNDKAEGG